LRTVIESGHASNLIDGLIANGFRVDGNYKYMNNLRAILCSILILAIGIPSYPVPTFSDDAKSAYKRGQHAESLNQYDAAYDAYKQAFTLRPKEPRYIDGYLRMRTAAAIEHVTKGRQFLENQDMEGALIEFQRAAEIDSTNFVAASEARRVALLIKRKAESAEASVSEANSQLAKQVENAEGPIELQPSPNTPITLRMTTTADNVYKTIGKLGGINVLFDLDYKPQKITIELNEVMMDEALRMVALESKTFWRPISPTAIFVAAEGKRKELESSIMKTFYLHNVSTPAELQEVVGSLKGMLDVSRIQVNATHSSITLRATPDQLVLAEKLVSDFDKPKPEVIIDVAVMQVSKDRMYNLGTTVPTSTSISPLSSGSGASGGSLSGLVKVGSLFGNSLVTPIPSATFTALMSDSNTKLIQNPEIRALNDEKASLKIGDRVPVATGSYSPGIGGGSVSPLVNTQFQYLDVGVNVDITPHIHSDHEVTLKMVLEISSVTGTNNIGGISQPVIGQRRIEHETRLEDGEVNLVGGILEDTETQSLSGYPWIANIPILKYLFGQENRDHTQNEIVFAITPHIVRADEVTNENLRSIDVGTNTSIGLRYKVEKPAAPENPKGQTKPSDTPAAPQNKTPQTALPPGAPTPAAAPAAKLPRL